MGTFLKSFDRRNPSVMVSRSREIGKPSERLPNSADRTILLWLRNPRNQQQRESNRPRNKPADVDEFISFAPAGILYPL